MKRLPSSTGNWPQDEGPPMISSIDRNAFIFAAILATCAPVHARAEGAKVTIDNFAFTPDVIEVKAGTAVTFVNHDDIPHSVVAADGSFHSKALDTDQSFSFTPGKAGEFAYFCGLHPHMKAKVVVVP
jgi:plastocyanin